MGWARPRRRCTCRPWRQARRARRRSSTPTPRRAPADWLELGEDEAFERITLVEAPTDRLLLKTLDRVDDEEIAVVDTPPGHERLLAKAIERASAVIIPTRVGGVETPRVEAVLDMVPSKTPVGLVICSARSYTRDYQDMAAAWAEANVAVWGSVAERVAIASGPQTLLSPDGLDAYRRRVATRPPRDPDLAASSAGTSGRPARRTSRRPPTTLPVRTTTS